MPYQPGDLLLDKYRIEKTLGQGAFGEVYLVMHRVLGVSRALKVLKRDAPGLGSSDYSEAQARFQLEAQLGAQLNAPVAHPHLLQVFDCILSEEMSVLEMEYASGGSLAERLQKARESGQAMAVEPALRMAAEVADGLAALHAHDWVHRDLKPNNILFDEHGQARVADLGLTQVPGGPSQRSQFSEPRAHPGTAGYMSPEQESSGRLLKPPSDVYSLGLVLFEVLTGRNYSLLRPGTRAASLRKDLPAGLDDLLARMLAENYRERPWDGAEAAGLLRETLDANSGSARQAAEEARLRKEKEEQEEKKRQAQRARQKAAEQVKEERLRKEKEDLEEKQRQAEAQARMQAEEQRKKLVEEQARKEAEEARLRKEKELAELARRNVEEERKRKELTITLARDVTMEFVFVPAGEFMMGSDPQKDKQAQPAEQPQHKVSLGEYLIGKYPVTNLQYQAFVQAARRTPPSHWSGNEIPIGKENHPVVNVSWQAASDFCEWAAKVSGARVYLPTEAEWEKAARGTDGRIFPWGDEAPDVQRCNFNQNVKDTTPVGKYSPRGDSPYGCADMAGNVWDWVADWYVPDYYGKSPTRQYRVLRGGSWYHYNLYLRSAYRSYDDPSLTYNVIGFRCACGIPSSGRSQ